MLTAWADNQFGRDMRMALQDGFDSTLHLPSSIAERRAKHTETGYTHAFDRGHEIGQALLSPGGIE